MFVERKDKFSDTNVIKLIITGNVFCLHNSTLLGYNTHFKYHKYVQTETLSSSKGRFIYNICVFSIEFNYYFVQQSHLLPFSTQYSLTTL